MSQPSVTAKLGRRGALLAAALAVVSEPVAAQDPGTSADAHFRALPTLGGELDDRTRLAQISGESPAPTSGYLLRSPSSLLPGIPGAGFGWEILAPELAFAWNSSLPNSVNDGPMWAGRGANGQVTAGFRAAYGPLSLVVAPQFVFAQNRDFHDFIEYVEPTTQPVVWHSGPNSIDLPLRPGEGRVATVLAGQSTLTVDTGPLEVGASTENQWWGPGIRNGILLSNNAPGFPHLFLRTGSPVHTPIGSFEGRLLGGWLDQSDYYDTIVANARRSISAVAVTFQPAPEPNLTLGAARSVQSPLAQRRRFMENGADALFRWGRTDPADAEDAFEGITSVFGRWVFPADGLEVYGEWARQRSSRAEVFSDRDAADGFTLGLQGVREVGPGSLIRLQAEVTYLEQTSSANPYPSFYTSPAVPQGYTQRGQVMGAAIGPGSSSQWLAADYLGDGWRIGAFAGRIRWDTDAFYRSFRAISGWPFLAHDVSLLGGVRGSFSAPLFRLDGELATANRLNYLYQNRGLSWEASDDAVDVHNLTLRLTVTVADPRPRPRPVPPVTPVPASIAAPADSLPSVSAPAGDSLRTHTPPPDSIAVPPGE